ncbi:membrane protein [Shewanella putrefaciens]|nr:membrane protein [Shewanella putrefaciens]
MVNISLLHWIKPLLLILGLSLTSQVYAWQDTDQDGVPDIKDACPDTP